MNPRLWDIIYEKGDYSSEVEAAIQRNKDRGFNLIELTDDQMHEKAAELNNCLKYFSQDLLDAGIFNLYFPKPEYFQQMKERLTPDPAAESEDEDAS